MATAIDADDTICGEPAAAMRPSRLVGRGSHHGDAPLALIAWAPQRAAHGRSDDSAPQPLPLSTLATGAARSRCGSGSPEPSSGRR